MTTIALMKTKEGVFLACDSQVTLGNLRFANDYEKIEVYGSNLIASCGSVGLCQKVTSRAYKNLKSSQIETENYYSEPNVDDFKKELSNINFYLPLEYKSFHSAGFLLIGVGDGGELKGFSIGDDGSVIEIKKFATDGSGSQLALGLLEEIYKPDLSFDMAMNKLAYAVYSASKNDLYTNDKVLVYGINLKGEIKKASFCKEDILPEKAEEKKE